MSKTSENNKRIAKNTLLLYVRMLFMMVIGLYTSRVILDKLGEVDFGIYNVVGGFVYKGVEYHTMADLRDALLRGLITEEDAQIIGKNI